MSLLLLFFLYLEHLLEYLHRRGIVSVIKMNANIYGHLDVARKQSIADKMGSLFSSAEFG